MRWSNIALLSLVVVTATTVAEASEQDRRPHRWWQSDEVKTLIELTDAQSAALDTLYRKTVPKQRESMRRLNAEKRILSQLVGTWTSKKSTSPARSTGWRRRVANSVNPGSSWCFACTGS